MLLIDKSRGQERAADSLVLVRLSDKSRSSVFTGSQLTAFTEFLRLIILLCNPGIKVHPDSHFTSSLLQDLVVWLWALLLLRERTQPTINAYIGRFSPST